MQGLHVGSKSTDSKVREPVRNHFFFGKLMDAYHFELETDYMNDKRWLLNRMVTGWGVVCGLDVCLGENGLIITPGVAIDPCGREIIVPEPSMPVTIQPELLPPVPTDEGAYDEGCEQDAYLHMVLCYDERLSDPMPSSTGDSSPMDSCEAGAIREGYRVELRKGAIAPPTIDIYGRFPDVITAKGFCYSDLVDWVTTGWAEVPSDPCIPLANLRFLLVEKEGRRFYKLYQQEIDIYARRIVYTNDLLFNLQMSLLSEQSHFTKGK